MEKNNLRKLIQQGFEYIGICEKNTNKYYTFLTLERAIKVVYYQSLVGNSIKLHTIEELLDE